MRPARLGVTLSVLLLGVLFAGFSNAAIVTSVEPRLIEEMDTTTLTVRTTGSTKTETLDLSPLEKDFEVLASNTQSRYRSVNGRVESWVEYQISLRPRRSGEFVVPSIVVGNERSKTVRLIVRAMDPGVKQAIERMVFFTTELSADPVYVQAETILNRRLYYSNGVQIYSDLPGIPEIPNAVVVPLGDTQSGSTVFNGQRYGVIEQQFAIFPEHSGTLIIPEISITSSIRMQSGGRTRRSGIRISTDEKRVEVLPIPPEYPREAPWVPATDVRITETWSPSRTSLEVGEPLHRTLSVTAIGNTGSVIPPLAVEFSEQHFKWYPEAPTLDDDNKGRHIVGNRIEGYSLIPISAGPATLAEVAVTWWDTQARQVRVAKLAPSTLTITGGRLSDSIAGTDTPSTSEPRLLPTQVGEVQAPRATWTAWRGLLIALAAMVAATFVVWGGNRLLGTRDIKPALLANAKAWNLNPRSSSARAWSKLKTACSGSDLSAIRTALMDFLEARGGDSAGNALACFVAIDGNAVIWRELNEAIYGRAGSADVNGRRVLQAARRLPRRTSKPVIDPLPDLFS